jgi:uncharacterized protein YbjQ (UPF0145 family)
MRIVVPFAAAFALLAGCASTTPRADFPAPPPPTTTTSDASEASSEAAEIADERAIINDPAVIAAGEKVRVIENDHLDCPAEVMGLVDIHEEVKNQDQALTVLKRKAAKMGAQAVIGVEFHHGEPGEEPTHLSGMAVRCNDLLKGRAYDVIRKIEIEGKMGKEDDAEAELLAQARDLHADLVINMGFEHGEGGDKPTRVWGTAIRFR